MTSKRRPGRTHKTGVPLVSRNSPRPAARHLSDIGPPGPGAHRKVSRRDDPPRVRTGKHAAVPEPGRAIAHRRILPTRIVVGLAVLATGTPIATAWAIDVARPAFVESSLARQRITSPAVPEQAVTSGQGAIPQEEDAAVSEPSTPSPEPSRQPRPQKPISQCLGRTARLGRCASRSRAVGNFGWCQVRGPT